MAKKKSEAAQPLTVARQETFPPGCQVVPAGTPKVMYATPNPPPCTSCKRNDRVSYSSRDRECRYYRCKRCVDPKTLDYWIFQVYKQAPR